jgi:hypothetical protein
MGTPARPRGMGGSGPPMPGNRFLPVWLQRRIRLPMRHSPSLSLA